MQTGLLQKKLGYPCIYAFCFLTAADSVCRDNLSFVFQWWLIKGYADLPKHSGMTQVIVKTVKTHYYVVKHQNKRTGSDPETFQILQYIHCSLVLHSSSASQTWVKIEDMFYISCYVLHLLLSIRWTCQISWGCWALIVISPL